ncbi:hypothetical protein [Cupriavidus sp. DL-D2]|uniref:hypothetical protein n=1 Tax=Cupriavidus sp. DL-D2 TaxID=3144974 RepID=UPI003212AA12
MQDRPPTQTGLLEELRIAAARSIKIVLTTALLGAVLGLALFQFHTPRWTAKMVVKLGQVTTFVDSGVTVRPLETQLTAVELLNQPTYRFNVLSALGLPKPYEDNAQSTLIFETLRATPGRGQDLVTVQVNAESRDLAQKTLNASYNLLGNEHTKMFNDVVDRMKKDLADTGTRLATAEDEYSKAFQSLKATKSNEGTAARDLFATNLVATVSRQILDLQRRKTQLEYSLESVRTYPTRVVDTPYVPVAPSSPGRTVYIGLGALAGLIFGIALSVLVRRRP